MVGRLPHRVVAYPTDPPISGDRPRGVPADDPGPEHWATPGGSCTSSVRSAALTEWTRGCQGGEMRTHRCHSARRSMKRTAAVLAAGCLVPASMAGPATAVGAAAGPATAVGAAAGPGDRFRCRRRAGRRSTRCGSGRRPATARDGDGRRRCPGIHRPDQCRRSDPRGQGRRRRPGDRTPDLAEGRLRRRQQHQDLRRHPGPAIRPNTAGTGCSVETLPPKCRTARTSP